MREKSIYLFLIFTFFCLPFQGGWADNEETTIADENDLYIYALASLTFQALEFKDELTDHPHSDGFEESIAFSNRDISLLWDRVASYINYSQDEQAKVQKASTFVKACDNYTQANEAVQKGDIPAAQQFIAQAYGLFKELWYEAIDECYPDEHSEEDFEFFSGDFLLSRKKERNFYSAYHIPAAAKKKMHPHLIPNDHPMKKTLDNIFKKERVILDEKHFHRNGFETIALGPRSYVRVARHKKLPGYLVKVNLDNETRRKHHKDSWEWFVRRCVGAKKLRNIIKRDKIKYFTVAEKFIYPLPPEPAPPKNGDYTRHLCILLVTDMNLESENRNLYAWKHHITKKHLEELYCCISKAKGSSYRPDNIALTKTRKFAFIDTEYPEAEPDFDRIRHYLNSSMRLYWDKLVRTGGHPSNDSN